MHNLKIILHGKHRTWHFAYDNSVEAGNKIIANLNVLKMYGKPRVANWVRLLKAA